MYDYGKRRQRRATARFIAARNELLSANSVISPGAGEARVALSDEPPVEFQWPRFTEFNWVRDYFDVIAAGNSALALRLVDDIGGDLSFSFADLADASARTAGFFAELGVGAGDRILIMLPNGLALWETLLAAIRLGSVIIPATTLLQGADLQDRIQRGQVKAIVAESSLTERFAGLDGAPLRIATGDPVNGWVSYDSSRLASVRPLRGSAHTQADDLLFLYFTSGTTAQPKLVAHTHVSYPVGHLSTMYWIGLRPGDVHLNLSSPGWAKHAWSSFFAPWNAQASILAYNYERFDPRALLDTLVRCHVTTFCAPPTVWRMLIQHDLAAWRVRLREVVSAGEPLNPEVISQVRDSWGLTIRDGYGQTETSAQVGNPPGHIVKPGSMGRPLPGFPIVLIDADGRLSDEGEICIDLKQRPTGLMQGYFADLERTGDAFASGHYHTGDVATRDPDGYLTYVGRTDDVFKSSDYRISPFELESVLIEHEAVVEAAVVPSPDVMRLAVPKAFVTLAAGKVPDAATAASIFAHMRARVSPYKRIRRLEFASLPKTISGKIRRVELRRAEQLRAPEMQRRPNEYWEEELKAGLT